MPYLRNTDDVMACFLLRLARLNYAAKPLHEFMLGLWKRAVLLNRLSMDGGGLLL